MTATLLRLANRAVEWLLYRTQTTRAERERWSQQVYDDTRGDT